MANQYYPWATAEGANALSNAAYYALTTLRGNGFQPGIASSEQVNTVLRQTSTIAAAVADFITTTGADAVDNGNVAELRAQIVAAVKYAVRNMVPVGTVITSYVTTPPDGYLPLKGDLYLRASYPDLFARMSADGLVVSDASWAGNWSKFSSGDGVTTFRVPDLRAMHIRAADAGRGVDSGRTLASYQSDQMPSHAHAYRMGTSVVGGMTSGGGDPNMARSWTDSGVTGDAGTGSEVRVKTVSLNLFIKY